MRQLPTGQYMPGTSIVHGANGKLKMVLLCLYVVGVICTDTVPGYLLMVALIFGCYCLSKLPLVMIIRPFKHLWLFFLVVFMMNSLFFGGETMLWSWGIFSVSLEGIFQGLQVILRVSMVMVAGNLLMMTTAPMEITTALQKLIYPLKYLKVPVEDVAMIITVAIHFIPILMEEADMIKKAQTARGARFESKKLYEKAIDVLPLVIPVFIAAFRRADQMATAMEARGYGQKQEMKNKKTCKKVASRVSSSQV